MVEGWFRKQLLLEAGLQSFNLVQISTKPSSKTVPGLDFGRQSLKSTLFRYNLSDCGLIQKAADLIEGWFKTQFIQLRAGAETSPEEIKNVIWAKFYKVELASRLADFEQSQSSLGLVQKAVDLIEGCCQNQLKTNLKISPKQDSGRPHKMSLTPVQKRTQNQILEGRV